MSSAWRIRVAIEVPLYRLFDYLLPGAPGIEPAALLGRRVRVQFGHQTKIGLIVALAESADAQPGDAASKASDSGGLVADPVPPAPDKLREAELLDDDLPALPPAWFALCEFAASYYQAPPGELMMQALPKALRRPEPPPRRRKIKPASGPVAVARQPELNADQSCAVTAVSKVLGGFSAFLLYGITGSGKTEVYLRLMAEVLARGQQVLLLVPEINLTPQLEARVSERFAEQVPPVALVSLHSELTEAARLRNWRAAFSGEARIVLGTRLSIFTPLPDLGLILVDEEHDSSYKQQDGTRYSARDLAVVRASQVGVPIVLGSATPSLESWANAEAGRYQRLHLSQRAVSAARLPTVRLIDTRREKLKDGLSVEFVAALEACLQRGEQSLVFLNRRGYAPVLACPACAWVSPCRRCAANLVVHMADRRLRCHHCGLETPIPKACPSCGNQDIHAFGRGTQRLEETLAAQFPEARILRVDRDVAKSRHQWEALAAQIHAGEADILVGTQMLAKGHDFPRLTLVGVVGADAALFAADWRAPERLFAQLMQVSGRAGRAELPGEVLVQTQEPGHPLYSALVDHDFAAFAASQLAVRESAGFPPYAYQAVLRADAPQMADALAFLKKAEAWSGIREHTAVCVYDPVPMKLARLANRERAQLMIESPSRPALQNFLVAWRSEIEGIRAPARLRWHVEVDPLDI